MRAEVAAPPCEAGARIVNDVSGGLADPAILGVVAAYGVSYVAMHWRAHGDRMQEEATLRRARRRPGGGVPRAGGARGGDPRRGHRRAPPGARPGSRFAKTAEQNWQLLRGLDQLAALGFPLLVGASRKSFLGSVLAGPDGSPRPVDEREFAGVALTVLLARRGIWGLRVHDVRASLDALRVLAAMEDTDDR